MKNKQNCLHRGGGVLSQAGLKFSGFTLAEMMVVMLIMSIILAAMAPVMTTRSKADSSSPWRFSPNNVSDAYFGYGDSQIAMIGQPNKLETDDAAKLIINSSNFLMTQISFKRNNTNVGRLYLDTNNNLILGNSTLDKLTSGTHNVVIGLNNLLENTSGVSNIAIGDSALKSNTTGTSNTALGTCLGSNTTGNDNTALGDDSLVKNTTGSNNVAVGVDALASAITSSWNIAIGKNAYQNGTGGANTIIGGDAMSKYSGENNVAVGTNALWYGNGNGNVSIGANSNYKSESMTTFNNSTAVGFSAYGSGENSVALGYNANATNNDSIAIGDSVSSSGESAIAIGSYAASNGTTTASGSASIAIGDGTKSQNSNTIAIGTIANASSSDAIGIGNNSKAISSNTTALGAYSNASGYNSTSIGASSSAEYTTSVALGYNAKAKNQDAVAIGSSVTASGESAIAIGSAGDTNNTTASGSRAVAIGDGAVASGDHSVALGRKSIARGTKNIAIGDNACSAVSGSNKICIGANSGPTSGNWSTDSEERIFIGSKSKFNSQPAVLEVHNTNEKFVYSGSSDIGGYDVNASGVVINGSLIVKGPIIAKVNTTQHSSIWRTGNQNLPVGVINTNMSGGPTLRDLFFNEASRSGAYPIESYHPLWTSDRRLKYVGKEFTSGLDKIKALKVYNYTFKKDTTKTPYVGVIAQDLQKVFPSAVKKGTDGFLTIRMEEMFYAMINAIKELDLKYQAQEKRINDLEKQLQKQDARLKLLESKIK